MSREQLEKIASAYHNAIVIIHEAFPDDCAHVVIRWKHPTDGTVLDVALIKDRELWKYGSFSTSDFGVLVNFATRMRNSVHATLEGL